MGKKLLLLVTDLLIGGTPTVVRELAVRLHQQGIDVQVACLGGWGPTAEEIEDAGVKVTALEARGAMDLKVFGRLSRLITEQQIDTVLSFLVHANAAAAVARMRRPFTLYQSIQTTQTKPRWHWFVQRMIAGSAEKVIVPSESVAEVARGRSAVDGDKIVVIPNAVEAADAVPARIGPEAGKVRVGFIGRLDPVKRVPDLLQAISFLSDEYELAIYGTGGEEGAIRVRIGELGIAGRAMLKGAVRGPWAALSQMDVLVLPSEAEGFGLVLIEAMAAGVVVVATDAPGIRDVVRDGENGLLVPVGNVLALALAIRRAAKDTGLRAVLVANGRRAVAERYSWESVIAQYRRVLGV